MKDQVNARGALGIVAIGRNEEPRLRRCLESALRETGLVVYVDSGSSDDSVGVARELGVEVVQLDPGLPFTAARARNEGIERLKQLDPGVRLVQVMDGDCELAAGWIDAARAALDADPRAAIVCGRRWERYPRLSVYNRLCDMEWDTPVGEASACGGDALIRLEAFDEVGGFDPTLIAGEEPELCVRLRFSAWKILRIDHDMTVHDARMTRFSQWFRRARRCGHAYAEGRARHGRSPARFRVREVRSILFWALVVPLLAIAPAWLTGGASLLVLLTYAALFERVRRQRRERGDERGAAALYARYCVLAKFPQLAGVVQFHVARLLGRRARIIEYADHDPAAGGGPISIHRGDASAGSEGPSALVTPHILYVGGRLPSRSTTFVYREVLGLRQRGLRIMVASIHPPERGLGAQILDDLADEAIPVYGSGVRALLGDAFAAARHHPRRGLAVLERGLADAISGRDTPLLKRPKVLWQALAGLALAERVRHLQIDHIHAHMAHVQTTVAMYAAMHLEVSFSFTGHAVDLFAQRTMLYQKLRRALFIVCISRWHRAFYQRIVGRRGRDLPIVRCGVDVNEFRPPADTVVAARSGPVRIVSVGRLVPKKGLDLLIEAISQLVREGLEVECRIIGDGPEMPRLRRMRIEQGVAQHLELPGALNNGDIGRELAAADLFVLPCRVAARGDRDGIPVALMEAMACGVCVVSGDIVTIRELIEHDRNGVMVRPGSSTALADALRALVHDPQRRRELGAAGRKTVEDEFALDLNLDRMAELFRRSVCGAAEPPQPGARTGPEHVAAPQVRAA